MELSEEAKQEIADAIKIVASDKSSSDLRAIRKHLIPETPENTPPEGNDPKPPPVKDPPSDPEPKKAGLWWGDRINDE